MADDQAGVKHETREPKQEDPTYPVDRLIEEAWQRFGEPPHVAAGAFADIRKKNLTIDEAKDAVKEFKKRPVEVDNPIGGEG